jgi:hypothetical protein
VTRCIRLQKQLFPNPTTQNVTRRRTDLNTCLCLCRRFPSDSQSLNIQPRILLRHCLRQTEVLLQLVLQDILQLGRRLVAFLCRFALCYRDKVDDKRILDGKDRIILEVVRFPVEYLRYECLVTGSFDPKLNDRCRLATGHRSLNGK